MRQHRRQEFRVSVKTWRYFCYKNFNRYLHSDTQTLGLDLEAKRLEPLDRVSKDT